MKKKKRGKNWICICMAVVLITGAWGFSKGNDVQAFQPEMETVSTGNLERKVVSESSEQIQLQIPQRMEIIVDPWEMDEKEQIYSEEYTVQNMGETPGTLILDFFCKVREDAGLSFQEEPNGIHHSDEKLIYMEVLFGTGEEIVFTREGAKYQAELQPGEILSLRFTGEVNENADDPWKGGDIEITGMYSWESEETQSRETLKELNEIKKRASGEDILPVETGEGKGESLALPDGIENDENDEDQVIPSETDEEIVKDDSLSGNELEE